MTTVKPDILLTADWHLTDSLADEYRWRVFTEIRKVHAQGRLAHVFILGDLADKKDRHSSVLVNRLSEELLALQRLEAAPAVHILIGNHDKSISGPPFWQALGHMGLDVITEPTAVSVGRGRNVLCLPHAQDPLEAWKGTPWKKYWAAFIHQTAKSAVSENGIELPGTALPIWPRGFSVYSGDVHVPQRIGVVEYVGAPHPIRFGDQYACRFLLLGADAAQPEVVALQPMRKHVLRVASVEELEAANVTAGDQVKLLFTLLLEDAPTWQAVRTAAVIWAQERRVSLAAVEFTITHTRAAKGEGGDAETVFARPEDVLRRYIAQNQIPKPLAALGEELLRRAEQRP